MLVAPSGAGKSSLLNAGLVPALRPRRPPHAGRRPLAGGPPHPHRTSAGRTAGTHREGAGQRPRHHRRGGAGRPGRPARRRTGQSDAAAGGTRGAAAPTGPTGADRRPVRGTVHPLHRRGRTPLLRPGAVRPRHRPGRRSVRTRPPSWCSAYAPTSPAAVWACPSWPRSSPTGCSSCPRCPWRNCGSPSPARRSSPGSPSNPAWSRCCCGTPDCATTRTRPSGLRDRLRRDALRRAPAGLPRAARHLAAAPGLRADRRRVRTGGRHPGSGRPHRRERVRAACIPPSRRRSAASCPGWCSSWTETGATRRRMSRDALMARLGDADGAAAALDAFVRARLITMDSDTVEITHEALLHAWPRLRGWIHADRAGLLLHQQLAHAAGEWEREGRDPSALYRGTRLDTVRAWADESDGWSRLGPDEEAFLRAESGRGGRAPRTGQTAGTAAAVHARHARRAAGPRRHRRRARLPAARGRPRPGARRPLPGPRRALRVPRRGPAGGVDAPRGGGLPDRAHRRGPRRPAQHPVTALLRPARRTPRPGQRGRLRARRPQPRDGQLRRHGRPARHGRRPPRPRPVHRAGARALGRLQRRRPYGRGRRPPTGP